MIRDGHTMPTTALNDTDRARAVTLHDSGLIEPAVLLVARHGMAPRGAHWNDAFTRARARVQHLDPAIRPPAHIHVTPHTLRHTFAVSSLAGFMHEGRHRAGDSYALISNPVMTVKALLGHADLATTQHYLYAAQTWTQDMPAVLARNAAALLGRSEITS